MAAWVRVLGAFAAVVVAAGVLRSLPAAAVLALLVGGFMYANHRLRAAQRAERRTGAELLGLRRETQDPFGLLGYPLALLSRSEEPRIDELAWGRWRNLETRVFVVSMRAPSLPGAEAGRVSFGCALAFVDAAFPAFVVEPQVFLTLTERPPGLPHATTGDPRFDTTWSVWSEGEIASRPMVDDDTRAWLGGLGERWGFELRGSIAMVYGPTPERADLVAVLETLRELLDRIGIVASASPAGPAPERGDPA